MAVDKSIRDLSNNRLFTGVKETIVASFFDPKEIKEAREGEILYKTGDAGNSIFVIVKGQVKVKFPSQGYVASKIHNDFFGEKEFAEETKRISSAMAFSRLVYYKIDRHTFGKLVRKSSLVEENLNAFGEFKIPESSVDIERKFNISERDKPLSFRLSANGKKIIEEDDEEKLPPSVMTEQMLPDLESIENSFEEEETNSSIENLELEQALEKLQQLSNEEAEEIIELPIQEITEPLTTLDETDTSQNEPSSIEQVVAIPNNDIKPFSDTIETGINREIVRGILFALSRIYSGISIVELIKNTKRALKDLTNSESADLVFIEEKLLRMYKVVTENSKTKNVYFEMSEGLTGFCATEKKVINYDRPTEDSHFNSKIDYPGPASMKRILYFPIISDAGETVAVLQTARDNSKFTEDEIWYLAMISKQLETAINKAKTIEQMLNAERINSGKKLSEIITKEIHIPIEIIDSYVRILNSKNLPQDTDDLIRMIQKQASSVIELSDSFSKVLVDEIVLNDNKIHFNEFIDDVLELLSEYCESKEVKLFKKIGDGAVVEIDRSKLYTAILQFIKAAVADSRKGDRVYLSTELIGDSISVLIQNEGKGSIAFPETELLDYFYSKEKIEEDEVYLLLARKIINAHSGQVDVESVKGVGSTIKIILPVAR